MGLFAGSVVETGCKMGRGWVWRRLTRSLPALAAAVLVLPVAALSEVRLAALYLLDGRRDLTGADLDRYKGAGVLWCRRPDGVPRRAAAAWLVADPSVVVLNAHNFRDRRLDVTRQVSDCYFQIAGRNYAFVPRES